MCPKNHQVLMCKIWWTVQKYLLIDRNLINWSRIPVFLFKNNEQLQSFLHTWKIKALLLNLLIKTIFYIKYYFLENVPFFNPCENLFWIIFPGLCCLVVYVILIYKYSCKNCQGLRSFNLFELRNFPSSKFQLSSKRRALCPCWCRSKSSCIVMFQSFIPQRFSFIINKCKYLPIHVSYRNFGEFLSNL